MELTEPQQLWVDALRSGKYKQGFGTLRSMGADSMDNEYCCLGVACVIAQSEGVTPLEQIVGGNLEIYPSVQKWLGLRTPCGGTSIWGGRTKDDLTSLNDSGWSFHEIADHIEKNADLLFVKEES